KKYWFYLVCLDAKIYFAFLLLSSFQGTNPSNDQLRSSSSASITQSLTYANKLVPSFNRFLE
ncbi:hypothetical protein, partial [Bacillus testis]|uniref:hypothetical protein n=1 Tax=Bacillus testis TaxID=1622072 RepID=UPI001C9C8440